MRNLIIVSGLALASVSTHAMPFQVPTAVSNAYLELEEDIADDQTYLAEVARIHAEADHALMLSFGELGRYDGDVEAYKQTVAKFRDNLFYSIVTKFGQGFMDVPRFATKIEKESNRAIELAGKLKEKFLNTKRVWARKFLKADAKIKTKLSFKYFELAVDPYLTRVAYQEYTSNRSLADAKTTMNEEAKWLAKKLVGDNPELTETDFPLALEQQLAAKGNLILESAYGFAE